MAYSNKQIRRVFKSFMFISIIALCAGAQASTASSFWQLLQEAAQRFQPTAFVARSDWQFIDLEKSGAGLNGSSLNRRLLSGHAEEGVVFEEGVERQTLLVASTHLDIKEGAAVEEFEVGCLTKIFIETPEAHAKRALALRNRVIELIRQHLPGAEIRIKLINVSGDFVLQVSDRGGVDAETLAELARDIQQAALESAGLLRSNAEL